LGEFLILHSSSNRNLFSLGCFSILNRAEEVDLKLELDLLQHIYHLLLHFSFFILNLSCCLFPFLHLVFSIVSVPSSYSFCLLHFLSCTLISNFLSFSTSEDFNLIFDKKYCTNHLREDIFCSFAH
jgi:hypothetical protein